MSKPELTIAIPTFGREEVLLSTLAQLVALPGAPRLELLVVDQTPSHEAATEEALRSWERSGAIRRLMLQPPSLTAARNAALRSARADVVLFLDDDMVVPAHLAQEHLRLFADPSVAAVTGEVFNCLDWRRPPPLDRPREGTRAHSGVAEECDARNISGGNHSVRRSVALAVGGYDEQFVASALGEDLDFSQRLLTAGHRIRYNPAAWIIHLGYPRGGCGITGNAQWPEWSHSANLLLYAFRHSRRQKNTLHILWMALRNGPLRKEMLRQPHRWPAAWWGFVMGAVYGWKHRRTPPALGGTA